MKQHIQPTTKELCLSDDELIVSKTDIKGRLIYCNEVFVGISGFKEHELLDKQHNIVRHPDMPRGVFKLLWDTIQSGQEFNGYVKNLCKDGSFYWVFANVTPSYDAGHQLIGYYSVRRKPRQDALNSIKPLYAQMLAAEQGDSKKGISASQTVLNNVLTEKGVSYDEFVCGL